MSMTGILKVTPQKLISTATEFQSQGNTIRGLTDQMLQLARSTVGSWEGDAQKAYLQRFNALDSDMQRIQVKIQEHVTDLQEMAAAYNAAESTNVSNISALSSDYITN